MEQALRQGNEEIISPPSALLLSASPAIADEFVYLKCVTKVTIARKDLKSNKITKREETETEHVMVNLTKSLTQTASNPTWREEKIVNGVACLLYTSPSPRD